MRKGMRRICIILAVVLMLGMIPVFPQKIYAASEFCVDISGANNGAQNYTVWASPVKSFLFPDGSGYVRVQYTSGSGIIAEKFDKDFQITFAKELSDELPIFGGAYKGSDGKYYIVTGQSNADESASVECYRITKYDSSFNRIGSVGLKDCNTVVPFDAGSCRMADNGKYLFIRTCHKMYKSDDGLNHQANVTIVLDMTSFKIKISRTAVSWVGAGYVSHSFNQFVAVDGNTVVALDHGDYYPRSAVLFTFDESIENVSYTELMMFKQQSNYNLTGASFGGLEVMNNTYLAAGNSINQTADDASGAPDAVRNIVLFSKNKSNNTVTTTYLTDIAEGEPSASTPQIVKLSGNKAMVLWEQGGDLFYATVDGKGTLTSSVKQAGGSLSDCKPVYNNGKVVWYTFENGTIRFHQIGGTDLAYSVTETKDGHDYQVTSVSGGVADLICQRCGATKKGAVPSFLTVWWVTRYGSGASYTTGYDSNQDAGTTLEFRVQNRFNADYEIQLGDVEVTISDPAIASYKLTDVSPNETFGTLTFLSGGTVSVTFASKYNSSVKKTITFSVKGEIHEHTWDEGSVTTEPTCTENGVMTYTCTTEPSHTRTETIPALGHNYQFKKRVEATCESDGYILYQCSRCDKTSKETIKATGHSYGSWEYQDEQMHIRSCEFCNSIETASHTWGEPVTTKEATEDEEGELTYTCGVCGGTKTEVIPKKDHVHTYTDEIFEPSCLEQGYTRHTCDKCSYSYTTDYVGALGHDWNDGEVTLEPTTDEEGIMTYTCRRCLEQTTEPIPKIADFSGVYLSEDEVEMATMEYYDLYLEGVPVDAEVEWTSSNDKVVSVDEDGQLYAKIYGKAVITASVSIGDASIQLECPVQTRFFDVTRENTSSANVFNYIYWGVDNGIIKGFDGGVRFGPTQNCTRQQFAIMIWRLNGQPRPQSSNLSFTDQGRIASGARTAVAWAVERGIIKGFSNGSFGPEDPVTRQQMVIMLWRMANKPASSGSLTFTDTKNLKKGTTAYNAILWASRAGIVKGKNNAFSPEDNCLRNQIVVMLYRYNDIYRLIV